MTRETDIGMRKPEKEDEHHDDDDDDDGKVPWKLGLLRMQRKTEICRIEARAFPASSSVLSPIQKFTGLQCLLLGETETDE